MATNAGTARDAAARRRRIAERGSERLALITGRIQSISPSPLPPSLAPSTAPSPPSISHNSDQPPLLDENNDAPSKPETASDDDKNNVQPATYIHEKTTETSTKSSLAPTKIQSFSTPITEQTPLISTSINSQKSESKTYLGQVFTPNRIRPAITSSENTRRNCSIIAAILALMAYAGFPFLGSNVIKYIILYRPLVLLILTNITIVAAPLLLEKVNQKDHRGSSTGLVMALEWGMLMKTGLSALFMDCSVYSVVLVCGMSFLQRFGW